MRARLRTLAPIAGACALAMSMALATLADAQTLYKLIDKNGKVTYSEAPPKEFDGQVIRIDVDPKANRATLPKASPQEFAADKAKASAKDDRVRFARQQLESARRALREARDNPGDDDVNRVGSKGGGARAVPSDAYRDRLARLEEDVRRAEEALSRAEEGR